MNKKFLKEIIKKNIIYPLWRTLDQYMLEYKFFPNINRNLANLSQKKVLVSYLTASLENDEKKITHTNVYECTQIIYYFVQKGYSVDIIHCMNKKIMNY